MVKNFIFSVTASYCFVSPGYMIFYFNQVLLLLLSNLLFRQTRLHFYIRFPQAFELPVCLCYHFYSTHRLPVLHLAVLPVFLQKKLGNLLRRESLQKINSLQTRPETCKLQKKLIQQRFVRVANILLTNMIFLQQKKQGNLVIQFLHQERAPRQELLMIVIGRNSLKIQGFRISMNLVFSS